MVLNDEKMSGTSRSRPFYWRDIKCVCTQSVVENSKSSNEETYVTLFSFAANILGHCVETWVWRGPEEHSASRTKISTVTMQILASSNRSCWTEHIVGGLHLSVSVMVR